jgi:hypothetical protein
MTRQNYEAHVGQQLTLIARRPDVINGRADPLLPF